MRRLKMPGLVNAFLFFCGAMVTSGRPPQAASLSQVATEAASAMERGNKPGRDADGRQSNRTDPRRLRGAGKLDQCGEYWILGEELQHLQRGAQAMGTILGGQHRRQHIL